MRNVVFIFALLLFGCKKTDINHIEIYYVPDGTSTPFSIHCDLVCISYFEELKTKKIIEKKSLNNIASLINTLEPANQDREIDARINLIIYFENKTDTLCLGEFFGTRLNGKMMKDSKELFYLIREQLND